MPTSTVVNDFIDLPSNPDEDDVVFVAKRNQNYIWSFSRGWEVYNGPAFCDACGRTLNRCTCIDAEETPVLNFLDDDDPLPPENVPYKVTGWSPGTIKELYPNAVDYDPTTSVPVVTANGFRGILTPEEQLKQKLQQPDAPLGPNSQCYLCADKRQSLTQVKGTKMLVCMSCAVTHLKASD